VSEHPELGHELAAPRVDDADRHDEAIRCYVRAIVPPESAVRDVEEGRQAILRTA
jgi:hypothetical protein